MGKEVERKTVVIMEEGTTATKVIATKLVEGGKAIEITYCAKDAIDNPAVPEDDFDRKFPIVEASKLSLDDEFLKHEPKTNSQRWLKKTLTAGIKAGLKDFRRPAMDPSFRDGNIVYEAGMKPALGESCDWWRENAKKFMPERNSRLVTETQYAAFLGTLIKCLINEMEYTVSKAWKAVCDNSKELGHYRNSKNAKLGFEATGSRMIGIFYDLANTCKILSSDNGSSFLLAGGYYRNYSDYYPLAGLGIVGNPHVCYYCSVGLLALDV